MGGQAFNERTTTGGDAIKTPRLSPEKYLELKRQVHTSLSKYFCECVCPAEAPDKADYGDIDFLVSKGAASDDPAKIARWMRADHHVDHGDIYSFALPYLTSDGATAHAQVDVHPCGDNLRWLAFMQSYGDIWQILGVNIRGLGFTATDKGLHVRLQEVEKRDRKASMIFLSKDPDLVMEFLGLDVSTYRSGFDTESQIFGWISRARSFRKDSFLNRVETSDDRRRLSTRGMFNRFITQYIPSLPDPSTIDPTSIDRQALLTEAIHLFGKQDEYRLKVNQAALDEAEATARACIFDALRAIGMRQEKVNMTIRGLKRWVAYDGRDLSIKASPELNEHEQLKLGELLALQRDALRTEVTTWILSNHEEIKSRESRRVKDAKATRSQQHTEVTPHS